MMLILVATPIGNLGDISQRALAALEAADVVVSEDTRKTGFLLNHFEIKNRRFLSGRITRTRLCQR